MPRLNSVVSSFWPSHLRRTIGCNEEGFVLGADTHLVRQTGDGGFALDRDAERCLALLSVASSRATGAEVLVPLQAAAKHWQAGDKALANFRLVFADLPVLGQPADAVRLEAAAYCLDHGLSPRELLKALDLDPAVLDLRKYNPSQPRVPAGNGQESGQWTDGTEEAQSETSRDSAANPHRIRVAANGPFKPEGIEAVPSPPVDPLDPANLNKEPPSPQEQQAIVDTLNIIANGTPSEVKKIHPHNYQNLPHYVTGAVLPLDPQGYKTFDVRPSNSGARGQGRLVLSNSGNRAYYTSDHYFSFYAVDLTK